MNPEQYEALIYSKAGQIRAAIIRAGIIHSPDPDMKWEDLPEYRKARWILLTRRYAELFG